MQLEELVILSVKLIDKNYHEIEFDKYFIDSLKTLTITDSNLLDISRVLKILKNWTYQAIM
mgnify:CR=1 FL=1